MLETRQTNPNDHVLSIIQEETNSQSLLTSENPNQSVEKALTSGSVYFHSKGQSSMSLAYKSVEVEIVDDHFKSNRQTLRTLKLA